MKIFFLSLLLSSTSFANPHFREFVGTYVQVNSGLTEEVARAYFYAGVPKIKILNACVAELKMDSKLAWVGKCFFGSGYEQALVEIVLVKKGPKILLSYKIREYGDGELGFDETLIAVKK